MAQVCNWLGYYLCLRDSPKTDTVHPDMQTFDAVIVWKETPKEKSGGISYEVILKPASTDSPRQSSPPKERPISQEFIEKKLKDAEERRRSVEQKKLELIAKDKARAQEAAQKIAEASEQFSKETEKKLVTKLDSSAENKNQQIKALQERLREHIARVEEARKASDRYCQELKDKLVRKMTVMEENRQAQLRSVQERIKEHEKRISEVLEASNKFSKVTEEKLISKMETTIKNREDQLKQIVDRLKEHERHVQDVRKNKMNSSSFEEAMEASS